MDKRYQFFISSTFLDLKDTRKEVRQTLLQSGQIPAGMEDFSTTGETQMDMIKRVLGNCDFCILIIGGRYGTVAKGHDKSYTEREYEYIKDKMKLPILVFIHTHPEELESPEYKETNETKARLDKFRNSLHYLNPTPWGNSTELLLAIKTSVMDIVTNGLYPEAIGWVRGNTVANAESDKITAIPGLDDPIPPEFLAENARNIKPSTVITWRHLFLTIAEPLYRGLTGLNGPINGTTSYYVKAVLNRCLIMPELFAAEFKCKINYGQLEVIRMRLEFLELISYQGGIWKLTELGKKVFYVSRFVVRKPDKEAENS